MSWWVYLLECRDGTLYTGCTDNIPRRIALHNAGRGAKYTRGRGPVILRYQEEVPDRSAALRRESRYQAAESGRKTSSHHSK